MPGMVPPVADEREGLLGYLAQQRYYLRLTAYGLADEQARLAPSVSSLSVGGLVKHVTAVERFWIGLATGPAPAPPTAEEQEDDYDANFRLSGGETLESVLADYELAARETETAIAAVPDLGRPVPVPPGVPWFPDVEAWSVRWVLLHLISETARHAGHADIVRETVDGATAFPLMAAAEGWSVPWMEAWAPAEA